MSCNGLNMPTYIFNVFIEFIDYKSYYCVHRRHDNCPIDESSGTFVDWSSTFAVRETASLGIMGAPGVPPLNPSESIVL